MALHLSAIFQKPHHTPFRDFWQPATSTFWGYCEKWPKRFWGFCGAPVSQIVTRRKRNPPDGVQGNNRWVLYLSSCYIFIASENVANRESRSKKMRWNAQKSLEKLRRTTQKSLKKMRSTPITYYKSDSLWYWQKNRRLKAFFPSHLTYKGGNQPPL